MLSDLARLKTAGSGGGGAECGTLDVAVARRPVALLMEPPDIFLDRDSVDLLEGEGVGGGLKEPLEREVAGLLELEAADICSDDLWRFPAERWSSLEDRFMVLCS
jgi:hypothetical protein